MSGFLSAAPAAMPIAGWPSLVPPEMAHRMGCRLSERLRAIQRLLWQNGQVTVAEIADRFQVSYATARRDVVVLAVSGRAVRRHGRLLPPMTLRGEPHFRARAAIQNAAKRSIALEAAQILPREGTVFVDAGTTCFATGQLLLARVGLRVVTNSVPLVELAARARATVIAIGGEMRKASLAMTGALAQPWLSALHFDAAVVGASGLDAASGAYTSEINEAAVKAEVLRRSGLRVLVADAEKWRRPMAVHFAPWSAFSAFVTNQELAPAGRQALAANHVGLHLARQVQSRTSVPI